MEMEMEAVWEELGEVRDEIEEVGSVLNAQGRFLRSEMEGAGNSVRTGVGVMQEMARDIRGEVRGCSSVVRDRCSQLKDAADKCEKAAGGWATGVRLGELERVVEGQGEFLVARHRELTRQLEGIARDVKRFRGGRLGQVEGDGGARAERGTGVAVVGAIGRSRITSAIVPWFRDVVGVLCGVATCGGIAAAGGTAFIAHDGRCDAADAAQGVGAGGGQVDIIHAAGA